jgi:uncharacterized protein YkwD
VTVTARAAAAALATAVLASCGAAPGQGPRRPAADPSPAGGATVIRPSMPPASHYVAGKADRSRSSLARTVERHVPGLTVSRCLEQAAAEYARLAEGRSRQLPVAAAEFLIHWSGCPDATAAVVTVETTEEGLDPILAQLTRASVTDHFTDVGVASVPGAGGTTRWVALLTRRRFTLQPVPRRAKPGGTLTLQFTLDPDLSHPRIVSTMPGGETRSTAAGSSRGRGVASVSLSAVPGQQWVELIADGRHGPEVVALFPLAVGQPPSPELDIPPPSPEPTDAAAAAAELTRLVNQARRRHNLAALVGDARLAAIAGAHSQDMAAHGYTGHTSPTAGDLARRFREAGYAARAYGENVARGPTIVGVHEGLMRSPAHRANVLSPRFSRLGIGVVRHQAALGGEEWVVTEEFAVPLQHASAQAIEERLRALVTTGGDARAAARNATSPALDGVARQLAAAYLGGITDTAVLMRRAARGLEAANVPYQRLSLVVGAAFTPDDLDRGVATAGHEVREVGVGAVGPEEPSRPVAYAVLAVEPQG